MMASLQVFHRFLPDIVIDFFKCLLGGWTAAGVSRFSSLCRYGTTAWDYAAQSVGFPFAYTISNDLLVFESPFRLFLRFTFPGLPV